jgi:hypothetical protein
VNCLAIEVLPTPLEPTIMILKTKKFSGPLGAFSLEEPSPGGISLEVSSPGGSSFKKSSPGGSSLKEQSLGAPSLQEPSASVVSDIGLIYLLILIYSTF